MMYAFSSIRTISKSRQKLALQNTACFRHISKLSFDWIRERGHEKSSTTKTALFLHGLLGNKKNWRSLARLFIQSYPGWQALVVDLRGHGESPTGSGPHNLFASAEDLHALITSELGGRPPEALCGHSFGGKVVLEYTQQAIRLGRPLPRQSWIFDTLPGQVTNEMANVLSVITAIKETPCPFESKDQMVSMMLAKKIPKVVALWLTTNLQQTPNGFDWIFDIGVAEDLFASYCTTTFWPLLDQYPGVAEVNFIKAGKNEGWTPEIMQRFETVLSQKQNVNLHTMDVGHWIHVEDPKGMLSIMSRSIH